MFHRTLINTNKFAYQGGIHLSMIKMKRKLYILIWMVFILLLLYSNSIVAVFKTNNMVNEIMDFNEKDTVNFSIDEIVFLGDIFGSFILKGWAFCETDLKNNEKEVQIILANNKSTYVSNIELRKRSDVMNGMNELNGIESSISTFNVENGIYNLYIFCKENKKNYGIVDTGRILKKDANDITEYVWKSSFFNLNITDATINDDINYRIDSVTIKEQKYIQINGWAFIKGTETTGQSVYVRLTYDNGEMAIYDTKSIVRPDIDNINSGFKSVIQVENIPAGDIMIDILMNDEGLIYSPHTFYTYSQNATGVNLRALARTSEKINIDSRSIIEYESVKYVIDSCNTDRTLNIAGWALINGVDSSATTIYLSITSAEGIISNYKTTKVSRPDVAKSLENELYEESGFNAVIPLEAISEGTNMISIIVDNGQLLKAPSSYMFKYNE